MPVLLRETRGRVEVLTLNRPEKRNALSVELLRALAEVFAELRRDAADGPCAVVVVGADPAWCAGLDLSEVAADGGGLAHGSDLMDHLLACPVPLIAAVNGPCVTGGLELALACDIRIGSERARFADTHARLGIHPGWGLTANLPRLIGTARAREMSFTGNYVDAAEAAAWGLISRVVPHERLLEAAVSLGEAMSSVDGRTLRAVRALYDADDAHRAALERERKGFGDFLAGMDVSAVVAARKDAVIARGHGYLSSPGDAAG